MLQSITVNTHSRTPKYQQIYNSIVAGIENKDIMPGDKLPSIREICDEFDVAKRTVEKAYDLLRDNGIVDATKGKGYYINHTALGQNLKVFLLFNKLSTHKKIIYDAFVEALGSRTAIDFFVYNNDYRLFKELIQSHNRHYTHYVIIAHFKDSDEKTYELLNTLPRHKLILLDKLPDGITGSYGAVYQNFEKDLYQTLTEALSLLGKYATLNILFPFQHYHPKAILTGFYKFCHEYQFAARVISDIAQETIRPQNAYINLVEEDLVTLIKRIKDTAWRIGEEVGILSYNETPLKELLLDGITVMSTDFAGMGRTAARLVQENSTEHVENPFRLIVRKSL